jgi:hypothetical protein
MTARSLVIALFLAAGILTATCRGQSPESTPSLEGLRRDIAELRQTVAELRERIEQFEYDRLPCIRAAAERPIPPNPASWSWLRFPIEIERAMMIGRTSGPTDP